MAGQDTRKRFLSRRTHRGTQVVFGERQHLRAVLESVRRAGLPRRKKRAEIKLLERLIEARTEELDRINSGWDRKFRKAQIPKTSSRELLRLASALPSDDYLLARTLAEHPEAPGELLRQLAGHPYSAVRENVARHPRTPPDILRKMSEDPKEPLWFLVACNPSTPPDLRDRLRLRMQKIGTPE